VHKILVPCFLFFSAERKNAHFPPGYFPFRVKDDLCGEVPVAFIKRIEGSEITENEIKQFVSKEVN
jgi:hypothetical protein